MVAAFLGILKAGGAYVPLDLSYPKERIEFMMSDAKMPMILTQASLQGDLPSSARIVALDAEWKSIAALPQDAPKVAATTESLAYVIYTSGSTGKPKGVAVPHRGIIRLVLNTDYVSLTPADRIAQAFEAEAEDRLGRVGAREQAPRHGIDALVGCLSREQDGGQQLERRRVLELRGRLGIGGGEPLEKGEAIGRLH